MVKKPLKQLWPLTLALVSATLAACIGGSAATTWYLRGDSARMRAFLEQQNIIRRDSNGRINEKQTILALVQWSRLNMAHVQDGNDPTDEANDRSKDVMTLIEDNRPNGYLTVHGCWGATSVFENLLGSVNIQVVSSTLEVAGELHSRADFPALNRTTLHMDDIYMTRASSGNDIPPIALLAPLTILDAYLAGNEDGVVPMRAHQAALAKTYLPDVIVGLRALLGTTGNKAGFGNYPTPDEVKANDQAGLPGTYPITDNQVLHLLDDEITRLGGPQIAAQKLLSLIDNRTPPVDDPQFRGLRNDYIPLPPGIPFAETE